MSPEVVWSELFGLFGLDGAGKTTLINTRERKAMRSPNGPRPDTEPSSPFLDPGEREMIPRVTSRSRRRFLRRLGYTTLGEVTASALGRSRLSPCSSRPRTREEALAPTAGHPFSAPPPPPPGGRGG